MLVRRFIVASLLIVIAGPSLSAETSVQSADRNAKNANVLEVLYPRRALAAGEQGRVGFKVTLDAKGHPTACEVTRSSGYPLLDEETCRIITLHTVFKRNTAVETRSQVSTHEGVVNWELPDKAKRDAMLTAAAKPAAAKPVQRTALPEKLICKKAVKVGYLYHYERVCMTANQWGNSRDQTRKEWEDATRRASQRQQ